MQIGTKHNKWKKSLVEVRLGLVILGLVIVLTLGLYHLFNVVLRKLEVHHRNGERLMDLMGSRLNEQSKQYKGVQGSLG